MFNVIQWGRRPQRNGIQRVLALTVVAALLAGGARLARADERAFTFTYEATTMPAGSWELENWVTWATHKREDHAFDQIDFRHELEYGVTDHFQLSVYLSDWGYQDGASAERAGTKWQDAAVEGIYSLTDPVADPLGIAIYQEVKVGDEVVESESKLLLEKKIGPFIIAWNGIFEAEWEGKGYTAHNAIFGQALGVSYQVHPRFLVGAEATQEAEYGNWAHWEDHGVNMGPNASYRAKSWWVTVTPLFQVTDVQDQPDFQTRLVIGVNF